MNEEKIKITTTTTMATISGVNNFSNHFEDNNFVDVLSSSLLSTFRKEFALLTNRISKQQMRAEKLTKVSFLCMLSYLAVLHVVHVVVIERKIIF